MIILFIQVMQQIYVFITLDNVNVNNNFTLFILFIIKRKVISKTIYKIFITLTEKHIDNEIIKWHNQLVTVLMVHIATKSTADDNKQ